MTYRVMWYDANAPHQIRVTGDGHGLFVGCSCGKYRRELVGGEEIGRATVLYREEHADLLPDSTATSGG